MTDEVRVTPVGVVSSPRSRPLDDEWGDVVSVIQLSSNFSAEALHGLDEFSHVDVVYLFHAVAADAVCRGARHPRGTPRWPVVGIFAQRAKDRPNRIGVSTCQLLAVDGTSVQVRGLDAIDGTPVLDLKPYLAEFAPRGPVRQPAWSAELMRAYFDAGSS